MDVWSWVLNWYPSEEMRRTTGRESFVRDRDVVWGKDWIFEEVEKKSKAKAKVEARAV